MAVTSATTAAEGIEPCPPIMERSPSKAASDVASESSSSSANNSFAADAPPDQFISTTPSPTREAEIQAASRSEEYRQLFRLPPDEILVQDFNCACQESILLQGHMYLFLHFICFYSNIFGFETKRIIPFHQITSLKRAKTAGIFPNAIEIIAGGKKYFFASFLSRDEAFKLINDGWLQHGNGSKAISEQQESLSENCQENGLVVIERVNSSKHPVNELESADRDQHVSIIDDSVPPSIVENDLSPSAELQDKVELVHEPAVNTVSSSSSSSSAKTSSWRVEDIDAPNVPEEYTKVAESKFPIKVEEFFNLFFSDDARNFKESFHRKCGDRDFRCSRWHPHDEFGNVRDVSFQHPLKIMFGPKSGSCKEVQKFRVYRNSHLVVATSQEINDVPFGDCFRVEGLWDVHRESDESEEFCILRIYVNVAFIKRTVWKGKIVQSTVDECRETYAVWVNMAHEMLRQKNLEKREEGGPAASMVKNGEVHLRREAKTRETSERLGNAGDDTAPQQMPDSMDVSQLVGNLFNGNLINVTSLASFVGDSVINFYSFLKRQNHTSLVLVTAVTVILLMQVSILVLLNRPQNINMVPPIDYASGGIGDRVSEIAWMEKRMHHLKGEVLIVEARLERMRHEHALLKAQIKDLEHLHKRK